MEKVNRGYKPTDYVMEEIDTVAGRINIRSWEIWQAEALGCLNIKLYGSPGEELENQFKQFKG